MVDLNKAIKFAGISVVVLFVLYLGLQSIFSVQDWQDFIKQTMGIGLSQISRGPVVSDISSDGQDQNLNKEGMQVFNDAPVTYSAQASNLGTGVLNWKWQYKYGSSNTITALSSGTGNVLPVTIDYVTKAPGQYRLELIVTAGSIRVVKRFLTESLERIAPPPTTPPPDPIGPPDQIPVPIDPTPTPRPTPIVPPPDQIPIPPPPTTIPPADTTRPIFTLTPRAVNAMDPADPSSFDVMFTTNENTTAEIKYGTVQGAPDNTTTHGPSMQDHLVPLTGLLANTKYYLDVIAKDAAGNTALFQLSVTSSMNHGSTPGSISTPHFSTPNFAQNPTVTITTSGKWSEIFAGRVLTPQDIVLIKTGATVTFDATGVELDSLGVEGNLIFANDKNTSIKVNNILVYATGYLEIGKVGAPIQNSVKSEIVIRDKAFDFQKDPNQVGQSLIMFGKVRIHGRLMDKTFIRLDQNVSPGDVVLNMESAPIGWLPGDELLLPDTRQYNPSASTYSWQGEIVTIDRISGNSIYLKLPLLYSHFGAIDASGIQTVLKSGEKLMPHAANLSRNVIIRSENPNGTRGHTLATGRADIDIRYASFKDLGRTTISAINNTVFEATILNQITQKTYKVLISGGNITAGQNIETGLKAFIEHGMVVVKNQKGVIQSHVFQIGEWLALIIGDNPLGKYALHMHHVNGPLNPTNTGYQFQLVGNSIDGFKKWGLTIHASHFGNIQDSTVVDGNGVGIATEDGSESNNLFERNFVAKLKATMSTGGGNEALDFGDRGDAFWFSGTGVNNTVRGNVATNIWRNGFVTFVNHIQNRNAIRTPKFRGADMMNDNEVNIVDVNKEAFTEFRSNEAYAATLTADVFWGYGHTANLVGVRDRVIRDMRVWNLSGLGAWFYYDASNFIDGWVQRGVPNPMGGGEGIAFKWAGGAAADKVSVRNADVQGMTNAVWNRGRGVAGTMVVEDSYFDGNDTDVLISPWAQDNLRELTFKNVTFGPRSRQSVAMDWKRPEFRNTFSPEVNLFYDFNGVSGDNFQVFYKEQAADFVIPRPGPTVNTTIPAGPQMFVYPEALGFTNLTAWTRYGAAIGGQIAGGLGLSAADYTAARARAAAKKIDGLIFPIPPAGSILPQPKLILTHFSGEQALARPVIGGAPANGGALYSPDFTVNYLETGDDTNVGGVYIDVDGVQASQKFPGNRTGGGSHTFQNIPYGNHLLTGYLVDKAGNKINGTEVKIAFQTAATRPAASMLLFLGMLWFSQLPWLFSSQFSLSFNKNNASYAPL